MSVGELLEQIAEVGLDPETRGYHRLSYSGADVQMRDWFVRQALARGFRTETDRNGNLWATRGDGPYFATGSHLDSVPNGGAFDGPLGIATAFAALDLIDQQRDVAVVAFAEEEGSRFGVACLGSRLATGAIDPEQARRLEDRNGESLEDALGAVGIDARELGPDPERLDRIESFIEVHIEQGRGLTDVDSPLAVAASIWPHGRWRLDFNGRPDHAGTTRMDDRQDPMVAFAGMVLRLTEQAQALAARATFGRVHVTPNATNAIPSRVSAWLDARAATDEALIVLIDSVSARNGVEMSAESLTAAVTFDPSLRDRISALLGGPPLLSTAAGHDAGILSTYGIPTAMIFVRNPTGVSHSPDEYASPEDCDAGVEALARLLTEL
ncbi:MAG: allantoate amidohydrolase [Actinobacteria bacterium]|nr:allantoate amidohydrolase [Actinomycetota bacterium]